MKVKIAEARYMSCKAAAAKKKTKKTLKVIV